MRKANTWQLIDTSGKPVIDKEYQSPTVFSQGLAPVVEGEKVGYMDKQGKMVIPAKFESGSIFFNGLAPVKVDGRCGYIDRSGKLVIEPRFEWDQRSIDMYTHYYTHFVTDAAKDK